MNSYGVLSPLKGMIVMRKVTGYEARALRKTGATVFRGSSDIGVFRSAARRGLRFAYRELPGTPEDDFAVQRAWVLVKGGKE